jgi:hypothetical protein
MRSEGIPITGIEFRDGVDETVDEEMREWIDRRRAAVRGAFI